MSKTDNRSTSLAWLADAPMFIDAAQIAAFYDAVVRPETEQGPITLEITKSTANKISGEASAEAEISIDALIKRLFPFLDAKASAAVKAGGEHEVGHEEKKIVELHPISSPHRQLVQLSLHYAVNAEDRLALIGVNDLENGEWQTQQYLLRLPRALAFIDLPSWSEAAALGKPELQFIPLAAELSDGEVALLFEQMPAKDKDKERPKWVDYVPGQDRTKAKEAHKSYWKWFSENFSVSSAVRTVEEAVKGKERIRWIDYRVPLGSDGNSFHLHICPNEMYDTGVFAYNLINRGSEHGIRLVGTLKSGLDMNVLAIFEK